MEAPAARFVRDLGRNRLAVADANVLIYHLEGVPPYRDLTTAFMTRLSEGTVRLVVSVLTTAEVLAKPYRDGDQAKVERATAFFHELPNTTVADVTFDVADRAAWLRARGLRMPDALILGTAFVHGADLLLTNDSVFRGRIPGPPRVLLLDDYVRRPRGGREGRAR